MKTPILGSAYVARSVNAADNRMVNLFPEVVPEAGKEAAFLNRAPGLRLLAAIGDGPIRGMWWHGDYIYVVSKQSLYKVSSNYTATLLGTVGNTGPVSMADNGYVMMIAANGLGYQVNLETDDFLQITSEDFAGALVVAYIDTYFVYVEPNSQRVYSVDTFDINGASIWPLVFDATFVASAEGSPDNLVSMIVDHNELWLFGSNSVEVWYNAAGEAFPFQRIQGAFNELGCAATFSVAKMDNGLFWLGADARGRGMVYRANGYRGERISTHAVEYAIAQYGNISDAIAYTYQQEGHSFYVLTFPTGNATWVYDASTGAWHERAGWENSEYVRHRSNCQVAFNSEVIVGDYQNGNLYAFDLDVYDDNGDVQRWSRSWRAIPTGQNDLKRTAHHSLQLDCESGVGVTDTYFEGELATETGLVTASGSFILNINPGVSDPTWLYSSFDPEDYGMAVGQTVIGDYIQAGTTVIGFGVDPTNPSYQFVTLLSFPTTNASTVTESLNFYTDYDTPWTITTESGDPLEVDSFHTPGADPQVMLRWSDDGGHTWSYEHWASMGKIGEYYRRVLWRRLGMTQKLRDRVYEIAGSDPVKVVIMGAELHASGTNA